MKLKVESIIEKKSRLYINEYEKFLKNLKNIKETKLKLNILQSKIFNK